MIQTARLGSNGPEVSRIGYGAMVLEGYYGTTDERSALDTLNHAFDTGMMIDTADAYGGGHNEELIAKALANGNQAPFIATKFGVVTRMRPAPNCPMAGDCP
jgi:aryl-alcohol dehydrogenase-like predicted oxidoreductase